MKCAGVFVISVAMLGCAGQAEQQACADPSSADCAPGFEYVVVGSGAGGGPLASRLARAGHRVLLLEAGDDVGGKQRYQVPAMHALSTESAEMAWWYFVRHSSDDAIDRTDSKWTPDGILYPRGSALGGSTAVNAMVTVLPSPSDWDRLAALTGDSSWRATAMAPYEAKVREWLAVELPDPQLALADEQVTHVLEAAASTFRAGSVAPGTAGTVQNLSSLLQVDVNAQLRGGETTGMFRLPLATKDGHRNGTRERILDTAASYPLTVVTGAFVTRIIWDESGAQPRAAGVEYVQASHVYGASLQQAPAPTERHSVAALREVVISAGAFNTPQLLMLSGVGPKPALTALGIDTVIDRPGVGQNLQDRYEAPVVSELPKPLQVVARCELGLDDPSDPCLQEWNQGQGVYETSGFLATLLTRSTPATPLADLQIFAAPTDARGYYPGYSHDAALAKDRFTWLLLKAHTHNTDGTVELSDASPFSRPKIHFHSYDEKDPLNDPDLLALVEGVKKVRAVLAAVRDTPATEVWPGPAVQTDADLAKWIRKESWGHHACCSSKMGRADDPSAVVDSRFRVIGAQSLRVVDASVFPEIPGTFIAMPIYLASERAADVMLEDAR
ncbi:MAG: GMC family oxidoreductase [Myxococcaceae bacterium]